MSEDKIERRPSNGHVDSETLAGMRELPPADGDRRRVAFLASMGQPWHGVDKILWLAEQLPDVEFHFIGWAREYLPMPSRRVRWDFDSGMSFSMKTLGGFLPVLAEIGPCGASAPGPPGDPQPVPARSCH